MSTSKLSPVTRFAHSRILPVVLLLTLLGNLFGFAPVAALAQAQTLTLTPVADAYVDAARAGTNLGKVTILRTYSSPEQRSYLRFAVTGVAGRPVTRATLRLYANGSSSVGYRVVAVANTTWSETGITYSNKPALGTVIASKGAHGGGAYTEVDVTSYIRGDGTYSLAITTTSTKAVSYPSREAGSNRPQLVLQLGTGGTTPPATGHPADTNRDGRVDNVELAAFFQTQLAATAAELNYNYSAYPTSNQNGRWGTGSASDWTSGFFPGALWQMYAHTGGAQWRSWAESWTAGLESQKTRTDTHDVGFVIFNSFVRGYQLTGNTAYRSVALQAANSLATRYDPDVHAIRSWSFGSWSYPVIIDNMMNLELLFWAARNGGGQTLYDKAVQHATTTLRDHVRADGSIYHLVDYNPTTGAVVAKTTHQGYNAESTWARGQAWGIYGFTLTYRETGNPVFLDAARKLADYYLAHVPQDSYVPYWDFESPKIPNTDRDSSGAAITASALFELSRFSALSAADQQRYRAGAENILNGLRTSSYLVNPSTSHALVLHSFGVHPDARQGAAAPGSAVNVPLIYTDMYFIEAVLRSGGMLPATPAPTATSTGVPTSTSIPVPTPTATAIVTITAPPTATVMTPTATVTATATATSTPGGGSITLTFGPVSDAYVDAARPSTNFGTSSVLRTLVSPEQRSYLRFNVQGLAGRPVTSVLLRVYANGYNNTGIQVQRVGSASWSENTLTYANMPALSGVLAASGPHGGARYVTVDLTGLVTGDGQYDLALTTTDAKVVSYPSREATSNPPQLVIQAAGTP